MFYFIADLKHVSIWCKQSWFILVKTIPSPVMFEAAMFYTCLSFDWIQIKELAHLS